MPARVATIVGGVVGGLWGVYNGVRLRRTLGEPLALMDVFCVNLALGIVCYFLNPDINTFNVYFFNGRGWSAAYDEGIVGSPTYFAESPALFFLFYVSVIVAIISLSWYMVVTRAPSSARSNPSSIHSNPSSARSINPSVPPPPGGAASSTTII